MGRFKRSKSKKRKVTGKEYFLTMMNGTALHIKDIQGDAARGIGITPLSYKL